MCVTTGGAVLVAAVTLFFIVTAYLMGWFDGQSYLYREDRKRSAEGRDEEGK